MSISERYYSVKPNIIFCLAVPLLMILFFIFYCPTFGFSDEVHELWVQYDGFCLPIIAAIELGVLLISRAIFCFALVRHNLDRMEFFIWMMVEFVVSAMFVALFLSLLLHLGYFEILPRTLLVGIGVNLYPYILYCLLMELWDKRHRIDEDASLIAELRKGVERSEAGAIRFSDEKGVTKLVVGAERVISIESAGNYVTILYDNDGKLVRYSLRNSLKNIEEVCNANGLVRCHRSFFVNLNKIKIISRTVQGVYAEIDHPGVDDIPVSKTYAPELLRLFSQ